MVSVMKETDRIEIFQVAAPGRIFTLESNRPFFRNRGLKHRRPDFKLIDGTLEHYSDIEKYKTAIMEALEPKKAK